MDTKKQCIIEFSIAYVLLVLIPTYIAFFHFDWLAQMGLPSTDSCGNPTAVVAGNGTAAAAAGTSTNSFFSTDLPPGHPAPKANANFWLLQLIFLTFFGYWTLGLIFFFFDCRLGKEWPKYRHNFAGPKHSPKSPNWEKYLLGIRLAVIGTFVSFAALTWIFAPIARKFRWTQVCNWDIDEPYHLIFLRLLANYFLTDIIFYSMHRLAHHPAIYNIPVVGHALHHTFIDTYAIDAASCSVPEHVLVNLVTVHLAPIITGLPAPLWCMWSIIAGINTTASHAGYNVRFFGEHSRAHCRHHHYFNSEYGTDLLMDPVCRTTLPDMLKYRKKLEKK